MLTPRYFQQADTKSERWLVSYVDVVTILLILFVAAAAQAVQHPQIRPDPTAVQSAPVPQAAPQELLQARDKLQQEGFDVKLEERGLVVSLPQAVLFASGQDCIRPEAIPAVSRVAAVLQDLPNRVTLIGHADATPIHGKRFRSNWELSAARSLRLLEFLTSRFGIAETRLSVASQGSYDPASSNGTADGRAANRRVQIVISSDKT